MTCLKMCESIPGSANGEPISCVKLRFHFYVKKSSRPYYLLDYMVKTFFLILKGIARLLTKVCTIFPLLWACAVVTMPHLATTMGVEWYANNPLSLFPPNKLTGSELSFQALRKPLLWFPNCFLTLFPALGVFPRNLSPRVHCKPSTVLIPGESHKAEFLPGLERYDSCTPLSATSVSPFHLWEVLLQMCPPPHHQALFSQVLTPSMSKVKTIQPEAPQCLYTTAFHIIHLLPRPLLWKGQLIMGVGATGLAEFSVTKNGDNFGFLLWSFIVSITS